MNHLQIKNLNAEIEGKQILKDFCLDIKEGEIHVIMGPNGTGKSTLSKIIMGNPTYTVTNGTITYKEQNILSLSPDQRSHLGIFLGMQLPNEIEGVTGADFLRTALHEKEGDSFNLMRFIKRVDEISMQLKMDKNMIHRSINQGFSGGEKKKNEILQMYLLEPSFVMLDEIDSGLDVDSLKIVGENIMKYYHEKKPAILIITHYQRLLDYIKPDFVHIIKEGTIIKTGDASLVKEIEKNGFDLQDSESTVKEEV
ncbi:MAG: Fe-S cluster assembly ATPase SufC [Bacilli bacterium]|nr:Fe-S cluster assembly ATPase SufC [Bacilli bacterium]